MKNIVCMLIIYNNENKLFLQDREWIQKEWEDYSFFGWHLENNETPEKCLNREIKEELNIDLKENDFKFLCVLNTNTYKTNKNYDIYFYLYKTDKKEEDFEILEWKSGKYFSINEAKKLRFVANFEEIFIKILNNLY